MRSQSFIGDWSVLVPSLEELRHSLAIYMSLRTATGLYPIRRINGSAIGNEIIAFDPP
jgi:hypothetical protein